MNEVSILLAFAGLASPLTAFICFRKGKPRLALMGAASLPAAATILVIGRIDLADSTGGFEDLGKVLGYVLLMVLVAGTLAIPSLVGAARIALPNSRWASRYSDAKKDAARARFPNA